MQNIKNKKIKKTICFNKAGFSLIEVLVAMFILSMGFAAVFSLMTINIRSSENAKNQIIASQLAQEGVELVRNLKDNNSTFTDDVGTGGSDYRIDYNSDYTTFLGSNINDDTKKKLNIDANNFYSHSSGQATKFYRKIKIEITTDADSKKTATVTNYVTWNSSGFTAISGTFPANCTIGNKCLSAVSVLPDYLPS